MQGTPVQPNKLGRLTNRLKIGQIVTKLQSRGVSSWTGVRVLRPNLPPISPTPHPIPRGLQLLPKEVRGKEVALAALQPASHRPSSSISAVFSLAHQRRVRCGLGLADKSISIAGPSARHHRAGPVHGRQVHGASHCEQRARDLASLAGWRGHDGC